MTREDAGLALRKAKELVREARHPEALSRLRSALGPDEAFVTLVRAAKWSQGVAWPEAPGLRVAMVGGGSLEHLLDLLKFWMRVEGIALETYIAPYDTWRQEIIDPTSALYQFRPEIVWLFTNYRDVRFELDPASGDPEPPVTRAVAELEAFWTALQAQLPVTIFQNNADTPMERPFGNHEGVVPQGRANVLRRFNVALSTAAARRPGVVLFDLANLAATVGLRRWHDTRYWYHSKHPFAPELAGFVAYHASRALCAARGLAKKCLVLDLDQTLWGGVIGDDGLEGIELGNGTAGEAFVAFQGYVKALADRGVVLAVCSKNEDQTAREPFLKHPAMQLRLSDIAVFKANWNNKVDNIADIASTLSLGLDSFVFVDDNPAERALVREKLPMVTVPELPEDPSDYIRTLDELALFELVTFSSEDRARGRMYGENAARAEHQTRFTDLSEYLKSLDMEAQVGLADAFHLPRMAQLVNKSNQFHPTTTRYTDAELALLARDEDTAVRWFALRDTFGDHGLIAVLVLKRDGDTCWIDTWAMSCRVLSRGMEECILRELLEVARGTGARRLCGRYRATKKNGLVADLYGRLGFRQTMHEEGATEWELMIDEERTAPLFIGLRRHEAGIC